MWTEISGLNYVCEVMHKNKLSNQSIIIWHCYFIAFDITSTVVLGTYTSALRTLYR